MLHTCLSALRHNAKVLMINEPLYTIYNWFVLPYCSAGTLGTFGEKNNTSGQRTRRNDSGVFVHHTVTVSRGT